MIDKKSTTTKDRPSVIGIAGFFALSFLLMFFCIGCQPMKEPGSEPSIDSSRIGSNTLSAGDVIKVAFPGAPQLDQAEKIRLDGKISLPMIGEVVASGKSPKKLQQELAGRYEKDLQNPKVIVSLTSSAALVYVNGEVKVPGKVLLDREMTVFETIMESGGFSELANRKKVILTRQVDGKRQRHVLNFKNDQESTVFYVRPYDTITVSQSRF